MGVWTGVWARICAVLSWLEYPISFTRDHRQIIQSWPDNPPNPGPKVAIFIHFDGQGRVGHHTLHYVASLRAAGFSTLFVTNSGKLRDESLAALKPLCAGILVRRNIGYDFGAMRDGLEYLGLPHATTEMVLLANDSVYGPLASLDAMLARIDLETADILGATESWQTRYHLQSFFVVAGRTALTCDTWRRFRAGVRPVKSKSWVVKRYEVGLTQRLLRAGLRCAAMWPYKNLIRHVDAYAMMDRGPAMNGLSPVWIDPILNMRRTHAVRTRHYLVTRTPLNLTSDL
ncbi:MAG TPA: rhamnan synthesis F family protein [Acetobacteraceae bacterium]